jgi:hypothetical protein
MHKNDRMLSQWRLAKLTLAAISLFITPLVDAFMPTYRVEPVFGRWYSYHGHSHSRHDRCYAMKPTSHYCDWNIDDIARDWMSKAVNETMIDDSVIARTHEMMNIFEGGWDLSVQCYPNIELINRSHRLSTGRWWIRYDFTTLTRYNAQSCIEWNDYSEVMRDDTRTVINDERITTNIHSTILRENSDGWFLDWLISRSMPMCLVAPCHTRDCVKSRTIAVFELHEQSSKTGP